MALSTPCDACNRPLSDELVTVRISTLSVVPGAPAAHRLVFAERPSDFLLCPACAETLDAYVRYVELNHGVPSEAAG
ncbi:MAG: hypothetical protein WC273_06670 [Dehalococcoidia bacterium]